MKTKFEVEGRKNKEQGKQNKEFDKRLLCGFAEDRKRGEMFQLQEVRGDCGVKLANFSSNESSEWTTYC
ncbi:hypothetical protein M8J76_012425 [Diaphorina citri]|nr:hypothetical protein M8J76_012425 [Diaphorina citri]